MRDIARAAGVGERTVYAAFPSKADLFRHVLDVVESATGEPVREIEFVGRGAGDPTWEALALETLGTLMTLGPLRALSTLEALRTGHAGRARSARGAVLARSTGETRGASSALRAGDARGVPADQGRPARPCHRPSGSWASGSMERTSSSQARLSGRSRPTAGRSRWSHGEGSRSSS